MKLSAVTLRGLLLCAVMHLITLGGEAQTPRLNLGHYTPPQPCRTKTDPRTLQPQGYYWEASRAWTGHMGPCLFDPLHIFPAPDPDFGYFNGTTELDALELVEGEDTTYYHVREHGVLITIPPSPFERSRRLTQIDLWLGGTCRIRGEADEFHLRVYRVDTLQPDDEVQLSFLGEHPFRLDTLPAQGRDQLITFRGFDRGPEIELDGPQPVTQLFVAVETTRPDSDDILTLAFTRPESRCGSAWYVRLAEDTPLGSGPLPEPFRYNDLFDPVDSTDLGRLGSPYIVPFGSAEIYEAEPRPAQINITCGDTVPLSADTDPFPGGTYQWAPAEHLSHPNAFSTLASPTETTAYTVTLIAGGDTLLYSVMVRVENNLQVEAGPGDTLYCAADTARIGPLPESGFTYRWLPESGLFPDHGQSPVRARPETSTTYTLTAINAAGCSARDSVWIEVGELDLAWELGQTSMICGDTTWLQYQLTGPADTRLSWEPAEWAVPGERPGTWALFPPDTTTMILTAERGACTLRDSIPLEVEGLRAEAGPDQFITRGDSIRMAGEIFPGDARLRWTPAHSLDAPAALSPLATPDTTTTYTLTLTRGPHCRASDTVRIEVDTLTNRWPERLADTLKLYPQPAEDHLTLDGLPETGVWTLYFHNLRGKRVWIKPLLVSGPTESVRLTPPDLPAGTYLFRATAPSGRQFQKRVLIRQP